MAAVLQPVSWQPVERGVQKVGELVGPVMQNPRMDCLKS